MRLLPTDCGVLLCRPRSALLSRRTRHEAVMIRMMALDTDVNTCDLVKESESIQDLAKKLPEGDALPDGFSEGFTEEFSGNRKGGKDGQVKDTHAITSGEVHNECLNVNLDMLRDNLPDVDATTSSCDAESLHFSSSTDALCAMNDGSPCSSPAGGIDEKEKARRFPVPLSNKDSRDLIEIDIGLSKTSPSNLNVEETSTSVADMYGKNEEVRKHEQEKADAMTAILEEPQPLPLTKLQGDMKQEKCFQTEVVELHNTLLEDELIDLRKQNKVLIDEQKSTIEDLRKSTLIREKLESVCRELQRQNKKLTDECKRITSDEQQKRVDLSTKFHDVIKEITSKLDEQENERLRQIKENELLQEKLKNFTQQYELRNEQYAQQLRTKVLEQQLLEVKLKQQEELTRQGEVKIQVYTEQITELLKTEQELRERLALYGDKFEQFQDTLTKSNEAFTSFKTQMEKMSKNIKKLEKENMTLQKKSEMSDVSLIELLDERANLKKQLETTRSQKEKLEALCRSLQAERKQQNMAIESMAVPSDTTSALQ